MSKRLRFLPALGAVFFASLALTARRRHPQQRGRAGRQQPDHENDVRTLAVGRVGLERDDRHRQNSQAGRARSAGLHGMHRASGSDRRKTGERRGQADHGGAEVRVRTAVHVLKQEVLGFLISSEWVIGEAGKLGVKVSDAGVKKEFEKIKNEQFPKAAEFEKFLATSGQTVSDLLLRVKLNMLSSKIQQKIAKGKGAPSKAEIEKYYKENESRFGTPEKRNVRSS